MLLHLQLLLHVVQCVVAAAAGGGGGSGLRLNPVTGGYEDIYVVVGEELPASSCPQILENIKVDNTHLINATVHTLLIDLPIIRAVFDVCIRPTWH
jgi:hypothetical protein